jgi:hypothetical protein
MCLPVAPCANEQGAYTVVYGLQSRKTVKKENVKLPAKCNVGTFGQDPVVGSPKNCWIKCTCYNLALRSISASRAARDRF